MLQFLVVVILMCDIVLAQPPQYSEKYAKVRFQPLRQRKSELISDMVHKEEVTESSTRDHKSTQSNFEAESEMTTEKWSEQINIGRFVHYDIVKDKLKKEETVDEITALNDETTDITTDSSIEDDKVQEVKDTLSPNGHIETLDEPVGSEVQDLNEQGIYYIVHPNGLFQKVVYKTQNQPELMQFSTEIKYENLAPIVEPIYTYDPRTFAFQRLLLQSQNIHQK